MVAVLCRGRVSKNAPSPPARPVVSAWIYHLIVSFLVVATLLHAYGFATSHWIKAKLDLVDIADIMSASGMGKEPPAGLVRVTSHMGLWSYCLKTRTLMGETSIGERRTSDPPGQVGNGQFGQDSVDNDWQDSSNQFGQDSVNNDWQDSSNQFGQDNVVNDWQDNQFGQDRVDNDWMDSSDHLPEPPRGPQFEQDSSSDWPPNSDWSSMDGTSPDLGMDQGVSPMQMVNRVDLSQCHMIASEVPDWMNAVRALGIIALIAALLAPSLMIGACQMDSNSDRARLLPYIIGGVCLAAGLLMVNCVIVYGAEYSRMVEKQMGQLPPELAANVKRNTGLGYSFALEAVSSVMFFIIGLLMIVSALRGWGISGDADKAPV